MLHRFPRKTPLLDRERHQVTFALINNILGMQKHTINLDNVNICIEILIRDDPPPVKRSSLKNKIP